MANRQLKVAIASWKWRIASWKWRSPVESGDRQLKVANRQLKVAIASLKWRIASWKSRIASWKWRSPVESGDRQFKVANRQLKVANRQFKEAIATFNWRSPLSTGDSPLSTGQFKTSGDRQFKNIVLIAWPLINGHRKCVYSCFWCEGNWLSLELTTPPLPKFIFGSSFAHFPWTTTSKPRYGQCRWIKRVNLHMGPFFPARAQGLKDSNSKIKLSWSSYKCCFVSKMLFRFW